MHPGCRFRSGRCRRAVRAFWKMNLQTGTAQLCSVHQLVSSTDETIYPRLVWRYDQCTYTAPQTDAGGGLNAVHSPVKSFSHSFGCGPVPHLHEDDELVSPDPRKQVRAADRCSDSCCEVANCAIPGGVALQIVDLLQAVEVSVNEQTPAVNACDFLAQFEKCLAVKGTGQRIGSRQPPLAN